MAEWTHRAEHWTSRHDIERDMTERSYLQWILIRCLAFGERDWIILCAFLFFMDPHHDFWSVAGLSLFTLGLFFIGPIYGIFLYLTNKMVFFRWKKKAALPTEIKDYKRLSWIVNICWLPVLWVMSYFGYDLFLQSVDMLTSQATSMLTSPSY